MKSTRKAAQEVHPTLAEVAAQLRARYAKFTPEQRALHGDEPDENTIHSRWSRIHCSRMSEEELDKLHAYGMAIYNGTAPKPHAHA